MCPGSCVIDGDIILRGRYVPRMRYKSVVTDRQHVDSLTSTKGPNVVGRNEAVF